MRFAILVLASLALSSSAATQPPLDSAPLIAAQREAMAPLAAMDGVWRGTAWTMTPAGRREVVHTERVGPFLDRSIKVVEGRAYGPDGKVAFNAFAIIAFNPRTRAYSLHSHALGHAGDFALTLSPGGYVWELPAGPGAKIRYTATIVGDAWREIGERIAGEAPPVRIFEMNLRRVGDTDWPVGSPVPMR